MMKSYGVAIIFEVYLMWKKKQSNIRKITIKFCIPLKS